MIKLYIVTYKKNDVLNQNLRTLWATARRPERLDITVISNHPDVAVDEENQRPNLRVLVNATRARNSWGYLARDWNFGIQDAFINWRNPNNVDWCVLAQNDVEWENNWDEFLDNCDRFDFISQPAGDQSMAINIAGARRLGFFDERFCTLHFHEFDYFLRAILLLGSRASINDTQGGGAGASWNPVGSVLTKNTFSGFDEGGGDTMHTFRSWPEMRNLLFHKWSVSDLETVENKTTFVRHTQSAGWMMPREINWYPFFWDGDEEIGERFLTDYEDVAPPGAIKRGWKNLLPSVPAAAKASAPTPVAPVAPVAPAKAAPLADSSAISAASSGGGSGVGGDSGSGERIGIIIQGPIATDINGRGTLDVLQALAASPHRSRLHICLTIWEDEPAVVAGLTPLADRVVVCRKPERPGSCNRNYQAHAVTGALDALDQIRNKPLKYVLKTRPDIFLSDRFLERLLAMADSGSEKVLVTNLFTRYESFHISDMVVFSTAGNVRMWFDDSVVFYEDLFSPEVQFARVFIRNRGLDYSYRMEHYLRFLKDWVVLVDFHDEGLVWFKNPHMATRDHNRTYGLVYDRDVGPILTRLVTVGFHKRLSTLPIGMRTLASSMLIADNFLRAVVTTLPFFRTTTYTVDRAGPEHAKLVGDRTREPAGLPFPAAEKPQGAEAAVPAAATAAAEQAR